MRLDTIKVKSQIIRSLMMVIKPKHVGAVTLRCVIPVVCVTNEREENVVEQHN